MIGCPDREVRIARIPASSPAAMAANAGPRTSTAILDCPWKRNPGAVTYREPSEIFTVSSRPSNADAGDLQTVQMTAFPSPISADTGNNAGSFPPNRRDAIPCSAAPRVNQFP
jgi:hypothetical protein